MKKFITYIILIVAYIVLIVGVNSFIKDIEPITTVTLTTQQTAIKFAPLIFISIFGFIILSGTGIYIITELWKYFKAHKQMLVIPFLLIALGFIQLVIVGLTSLNTLMKSNVEAFIANNEVYIKALMSLSVYTWVALGLFIASVVYQYLLNKEII